MGLDTEGAERNEAHFPSWSLWAFMGREKSRQRELNQYLHVALPTSELYTNASSAVDTIVT